MPAVLVNGHASFVWGPSAAKALENAQALEVVAEMSWKALQINPEMQSLNRYLVERHFFRKHGANSYYGQRSSQHDKAVVAPMGT
jgi:L-ribulose-5-phosphate 4-epimerase